MKRYIQVAIENKPDTRAFFDSIPKRFGISPRDLMQTMILALMERCSHLENNDQKTHLDELLADIRIPSPEQAA